MTDDQLRPSSRVGMSPLEVFRPDPDDDDGSQGAGSIERRIGPTPRTRVPSWLR